MKGFCFNCYVKASWPSGLAGWPSRLAGWPSRLAGWLLRLADWLSRLADWLSHYRTEGAQNSQGRVGRVD